MKVENLKHPFTLQEIVENFGDYKIFKKLKIWRIFFQKIRNLLQTIPFSKFSQNDENPAQKKLFSGNGLNKLNKRKLF
jgi:hypothetical protein